MKKRIPSFCAGIISAILVMALVTTALAASGQVSFNFSNIALDGEIKIASGKTITAPNGQEVPSSILYTDEIGGKTNYLPVRAISELLGVEIGYDSASKTVFLGRQPDLQQNVSQANATKRWQREINGRNVLYFCDEENRTYDSPLTFRPTWEKAGWAITKISHDTRNYTTTWEYQGPDGQFSLKCAYPSTADLARQMNSTEAIQKCRTLSIQGYAADFYQDGKHNLIAWENSDGVLFFLLGKNTPEKLLAEVAESVKPCTESVADYAISWLPKNYSMMDHYKIADTVQEYWVRDDVALSWMYSASEMQAPTWESSPVEINGIDGQYWSAQVAFERDLVSTGGTTIAIPAPVEMNTLIWQDPDTGVTFRLQSILDKDTMLRIAENIK